MKVTTPQEKSVDPNWIEPIIKKFEDKLSKEEGGRDYYQMVIIGEYGRPTCDAIEKTYISAGWGEAICKTSSENGERPGLTRLQLWIKKELPLFQEYRMYGYQGGSYFVIEDNGGEKVLISKFKNASHPEYQDYWVDRRDVHEL